MMVGLTGGIGSGKSFCAALFEEAGVPVYYSDDRAKALMTSNNSIISKIKQLFGEESYHEDGSLNKSLIAQAIFNNAELLKAMNAIVHPAVREDFYKWHMISSEEYPYTIQESALLFETGSYQFFDAIILVDAPKYLRLQRVISRDKTTRKEVLARMAKQMPAKAKRPHAHYIIRNDGRKSVLKQVMAIHYRLMKIAENNK